MALKKHFSFDTKYGVPAVVPDCYIKVERVEVTAKHGFAVVHFYRGDMSELLDEARYDFPVSLEGVNFISQAYEHIKTLPEFADAIDC